MFPTKRSLAAFCVALLINFASAVVLNGQTREVSPKSEVETSRPAEKKATPDERIGQLEAQVAAMQQQIEELKKLLTAGTQAAAAKPEVKEPAAEAKPTETARSETVPTGQQKPELGVNLGSARLTPYGSIYFNAFTNTGGTNNADVPLFATPTGRGGASASLRQTRFGVRLEGARAGNANLSAVLEADFFGGFPSVGIGENFGVVRLRLANVKLAWEKTSLTLGQDWSVFAPASPTSLAAAAIPQMAAAGNNWARLPQIKAETRFGKFVTMQAAVAAPQSGDSATNAAFFLQPNSGTASRVPYFQGRVSLADTNVFGTKKPGSIAISGHYGRSRVFTGASGVKNDSDSVGIALDWNLPLHDRLILTGEAFTGRNLAGFQGGIFQGLNAEFAYRQGTTLVPGGVRAIGTRGGWAQLGFTPEAFRDRLTIYGSFGLDDPRNEDLVTFVPRDVRTRNFAAAIEAIYKFTPQFSAGIEFRRFRTDWTLSGRQNSNHVNLAAVYSF